MVKNSGEADSDPISKRLALFKTTEGSKTIARLKSTLKFDEQGELLLRLLKLINLRKVSARADDLQTKVKNGEDINNLLMDLVAELDADVVELVRSLQAADSGAVEDHDDAGDHANDNGDYNGDDGTGADMDAVVAEVRERMELHASNKPRTDTVTRLRKAHNFSDHVDLALRLLEPDMFEELIAGEGHLNAKLRSAPDKDKLMLTLISALDPRVGELVHILHEKDTMGKPGGSAQRAAIIKPVNPKVAAKAKVKISQAAVKIVKPKVTPGIVKPAGVSIKISQAGARIKPKVPKLAVGVGAISGPAKPKPAIKLNSMAAAAVRSAAPRPRVPNLGGPRIVRAPDATLKRPPPASRATPAGKRPAITSPAAQRPVIKTPLAPNAPKLAIGAVTRAATYRPAVVQATGPALRPGPVAWPAQSWSRSEPRGAKGKGAKGRGKHFSSKGW